MLEIEYNPSDFIPLRDLGLSEKESLSLFWKLRTFFEDRNPGHIIDASDAHIITVFPFADGDAIPDDYDVMNYAVGMINDKPALLKLDENQEILVLEGAEEEFLTNQHLNNNDEVLPSHASEGCPFCNLSDDEEIIAETPTVVAVFDKYPVSPGHTLIIPKRHITLYRDLSVYEMNAMTYLLQYVKKKIDERYHPDGYNVGINIGEAAGQSVFHCHMHIIPRYKGDVPNPKGGVRGVIPNKQKYTVKTDGEQGKSKKDCIVAKRAEHGNAYQKWTQDDDELLIKHYEGGYTIFQLSEVFKRGQGAIKSRLRKLGKELSDGQDV